MPKQPTFLREDAKQELIKWFQTFNIPEPFWGQIFDYKGQKVKLVGYDSRRKSYPLTIEVIDPDPNKPNYYKTTSAVFQLYIEELKKQGLWSENEI